MSELNDFIAYGTNYNRVVSIDNYRIFRKNNYIYSFVIIIIALLVFLYWYSLIFCMPYKTFNYNNFLKVVLKISPDTFISMNKEDKNAFLKSIKQIVEFDLISINISAVSLLEAYKFRFDYPQKNAFFFVFLFL